MRVLEAKTKQTDSRFRDSMHLDVLIVHVDKVTGTIDSVFVKIDQKNKVKRMPYATQSVYKNLLTNQRKQLYSLCTRGQ